MGVVQRAEQFRACRYGTQPLQSVSADCARKTLFSESAITVTLKATQNPMRSWHHEPETFLGGTHKALEPALSYPPKHTATAATKRRPQR